MKYLSASFHWSNAWLGDFQEKQPWENLIKGMNYIENSWSKNGKDLNRSAPKHENPNEFVDNSQNFLEETKEPLEGIIGKQDDETKSNEVINHFHFVHSAGDIRMRDKTIAELGMSKRKDVVLKSLLRKI